MARTASSSCRHPQMPHTSAEVLLPASPRVKRATSREALKIEERTEPRFDCQLAVQLRELTPTTDTMIAILGGVVTDMSRGGICIRTIRPLTTYSSVRCEITLPNSSISLPTLMQVRWVRQTGPCTYACGLTYLV